MTAPLDAHTSRPRFGGPSFSLANRIERLAWNLSWPVLARILPPPFGWGWRRTLLRLFGAKMEPGAVVYPSVSIWLPRHLSMARYATLGPGVRCYNMAPIALEEHATVSQRAFLCAGDHDHRDAEFQLVTRPITLRAHSWVAAEAFVAPGITLGKGAVLAARGVAVKDLDPWTVWGGNPAVRIGDRPAPSDRH